jgi:formylglycine-generating enzyme required for sulfatase activity
MFQFNRLVGVAVLLAIAFVAAPVTALAQTSAPIEWKVSDGGNGHWYKLVIAPNTVSWSDADAAAALLSAHLATLTSANENAFVFAVANQPGAWGSVWPDYSAGPWLGAFRDSGTSAWRWVTGETWSWTNWLPPNPDGPGFWNENRLSFATNYSSQWNDFNESGSQPCCKVVSYVLEFDADCNGDGIVDYGQILSGELVDDNNNNVPDICESQTWATVLEYVPNPAVVTDANLRAAIVATNLPWRVLDNGTNIEMLLVPGGIFTMGCSASNSWNCKSDETTHQVTLSKAFYLGKTEVTQAQWTAKMLSNPSYFSGNPNNPVERVSWNDIAGFNTATGLRLPSEAEWEYACRGGTTTAFHSMPGYPNGTNVDSLLGNIAWYSDNSGSTSHAVGGKAANVFGVYDISGNVWEWCNDWYGDYSASSVTDPTGPATGSSRVLRGGSLTHGSYGCRSSYRDNAALSTRYGDLGFRAARTPNVLNVPSQFATIQAAINAAPTSGWTIQVAPGTYNEAIDFKGKAITVKATGARASTIVDGTGLTTSVVRAVTGETSATVLQGFTIRNGPIGSASGTYRLGGGIFISNASPTIRDCAFTANQSAYGGGMYALYSNSLVENCTFSQNSGSADGGGMQLFGGSPIVRNCVVSDNTAGNRGGGFHVVQHNTGAAIVNGCTISGNRSLVSDGGGISIASLTGAAQKFLVSNCNITNNFAQARGGGVWAVVDPANPQQNVTLSGNTICNNTSAISKRENVWALFEDGGNAICDCISDINGDRATNSADLGIMLGYFGTITDPDFIQPDQDMNGKIDSADLGSLLSNFGDCAANLQSPDYNAIDKLNREPEVFEDPIENTTDILENSMDVIEFPAHALEPVAVKHKS